MSLLLPALPPGERFGILAELPTPDALLQACRGVREAGYTRWDAHAPFLVPGLGEAMGLPASPVPRLSLLLALGGAAAGAGLVAWVSGSAFPLVISGDPHFTWPALLPATVALALLGSALGAVVGLLALGRLPRLYHPLFSSNGFERVTDDGFFLSIESWDPQYDADRTGELLRRLGAVRVELVPS